MFFLFQENPKKDGRQGLTYPSGNQREAVSFSTVDPWLLEDRWVAKGWPVRCSPWEHSKSQGHLDIICDGGTAARTQDQQSPAGC